MTNRMLAVFDSPEEVALSVDALKREGIDPNAISLISSEPVLIEGLEERASRPSRIGLFSIAGGIVGAIAAILLTVITSNRVNLVTGGMPIVAPWAFGIIVFEVGALGAIGFALFRMIYEAGLGRRFDVSAYKPEVVADGKLVLVVDCKGEENQQTARTILAERLEEA